MNDLGLMKWYIYSDLDGEHIWISPMKPKKAIYGRGWFLIGEL